MPSPLEQIYEQAAAGSAGGEKVSIGQTNQAPRSSVFDIFEQQAGQFNATIGKMFSGLQQNSQRWAGEQAEAGGRVREFKKNGKRMVWDDVTQSYVPNEYMKGNLYHLMMEHANKSTVLQQLGAGDTHGSIDPSVGFTEPFATPAMGPAPGGMPSGGDFGPAAMP